MSNMLPPNATKTERALAEVANRATDLPIPIARLLNPTTCPSHILPWLAWACSVDHWDDAWTESQKRAVIASSFTVHQTKGTVKAVKTAVGALGYRTRLQQWWQTDDPAYTFRVTVYINDRPIDAATLSSIHSMIEGAKNARSAYVLSLATETNARLNITSALMTSRTVRVGPWQPTESTTEGNLRVAAALITHTKVRVTPQ